LRDVVDSVVVEFTRAALRSRGR